MHPTRRWLYRAEIAASLLSVALFALTQVDPQWIERFFDESPDGGDGSIERWLVGGAFLVAAVLAAALARRERRRAVAVDGAL
jgi:hypothetical protein